MHIVNVNTICNWCKYWAVEKRYTLMKTSKRKCGTGWWVDAYYIISYYIILYYIILYYIILYHIISYYTISSLSWQCMSIMLLFSRHSQEKKDRENLRADISENAAGNRKLAKRQRTFSQKIFWKWGIIWKFLWN